MCQYLAEILFGFHINSSLVQTAFRSFPPPPIAVISFWSGLLDYTVALTRLTFAAAVLQTTSHYKEPLLICTGSDRAQWKTRW